MARAVYSRVGSGPKAWMRRTWVTDAAAAWAHAKRVPKAVRRIGDETKPGGELVVWFDTVAKTAKKRPPW